MSEEMVGQAGFEPATIENEGMISNRFLGVSETS